MPNAVGGGLCRVTVVAPKTRIDLALPEDVPLADLQPTLLRYTGAELAEDGTGHGGWVLARLGGEVLDSSRSAAQLAIRDGEQLYFTPRNATAPDAVFDDVVDAIATATQRQGGRWRPAHTRRYGLVTATLALLAAAGFAAFNGPPQLPGALTALGAAAVLAAAAVVFSRALGDSATAAVLGTVSLVHGTLGGLLLLGGHRTLTGLGAPHALVAGTALLLLAVVNALAVADYPHLFLGAAICAVGLALGAAISLLTGTSAAGAGAVVACLALAATPLLPMTAFRLGRIPMPSVPSGGDDLKADVETVDGQLVLDRSRHAERYLTGLLGATAVTGLGAELALVFGAGGWPRIALCAAVALVLITRARSFLTTGQRVPLLVAGLAGLGLLALAVFTQLGPGLRLAVVLPGVLVFAVVCLVLALALAGRPVSPVLSRIVDVLEIAIIVSVIPLTMWVCGLYGWIRAIKG